MKTLQPRKADFRFAPIFVKETGSAKAIGHQPRVGGRHKDVRPLRKPRSTQRINLSKEGY